MIAHLFSMLLLLQTQILKHVGKGKCWLWWKKVRMGINLTQLLLPPLMPFVMSKSTVSPWHSIVVCPFPSLFLFIQVPFELTEKMNEPNINWVIWNAYLKSSINIFVRSSCEELSVSFPAKSVCVRKTRQCLLLTCKSEKMTEQPRCRPKTSSSS